MTDNIFFAYIFYHCGWNSILFLVATVTTAKMYQSRCTVKNSWWWAERVPETCRVVIPIKLEFSASVRFKSQCTVKNSWWWAERLPETCRVVIPIKLEFSASVGFNQKESVTMHGHTILRFNDITYNWSINPYQHKQPCFS